MRPKKKSKRYRVLELKEKELMKELKNIQDEKADIAADDIDISDHAFTRFVERVHPELYSQLKREILPFDVRKQIITLGGKGRFPVGTSHKIEVNDYKVITTLT